MRFGPNKLKRLSITCRILLCISVAIALVDAFHPLLNTQDNIVLNTDEGVMSFMVGEVDLKTRSLITLVLLIPSIFWIYGLYSIWKMCQCFQKGQIFEVRPMRHFEYFGWMVALTGLAQFALSPLTSLILNQSSILNGAKATVSLDLSNGIEYWVAAIVIALVARILKESVILSKEVESFI